MTLTPEEIEMQNESRLAEFELLMKLFKDDPKMIMRILAETSIAVDGLERRIDRLEVKDNETETN